MSGVRGKPSLSTRAARSLFSEIKPYGTITLVFLSLVQITLNLALAVMIMHGQEAMADSLRSEPVPTVAPTAPVPTVTVTKTRRPKTEATP